MNHKKITIAFLVLFAFSFRAFAQMTILSGSKQATQYRLVQDMQTIFAPDVKITNKESSGSAYNFDQIADPSSPYKMAIIQADYLNYMQSQDMRLNTHKTEHMTV